MNVQWERIWCSVCDRMRLEYGDPLVVSWIKPLVLEKIENGVLTLRAPSAFFRDWVCNNYSKKLVEFCKLEDPEIHAINITVEQLSPDPKEKKKSTSKGGGSLPLFGEKSSSTRSAATSGEASVENDLGISLDPKLTFENFVVGKPNEFAYAAAQRVAMSENIAFNPLFLYGGVGLGKTHLMHAIAWEIKKMSPQKVIAYMSAEKFMYHFIKSVRYKDTMAFKDQFRSIDVLMIDDIQFICGKDSTQEEFFHTFNSLIDNNRQVVVSADKSPSDLDDMEDRLKSRLGWGLVADIHPTTYELRLGILQSKAGGFSIKIPDRVLEFIAHKVTSNVRELEGALNRIVANAVFIGREVTVDNAREVLSDLLRTSDRKVTVDEIQKQVAAHYLIKLSDMMSSKRTKQITVPRQVAMYLTKTLTTMSLPEIGKSFGGRDHTTILHAFRKVQTDLEKDSSLAEDIRLLTTILTK